MKNRRYGVIECGPFNPVGGKRKLPFKSQALDGELLAPVQIGSARPVRSSAKRHKRDPYHVDALRTTQPVYLNKRTRGAG